jgi:peptidylprolyl isomerase
VSEAKSGDKVKIHYSGTLDDGTQFDSSEGREPLEFDIGSGQVIPGFETAVIGMVVGDNKSISIPPEEAYGPYHKEMVQDIPGSALPEDLTPAIGMQLQGTGADGQTMQFVITEVKDGAITVDGNHPLAGEALNFEIELVAIA